MAKDYKRRANSTQRAQPVPARGWVWFASGVLTGCFFCALLWLKLQAPVATPRATTHDRPPPAPDTAESHPAAPKPRFDFYTILPEMEVVVPDPEPEAEPEPPRSASSAKPPAKPAGQVARYMLQMGSFRKYADADRLKASLALVGIQAEIQKVTVGADGTYHRVRAGPYSRAQAKQLRQRLKQNNINSLMIQLKG